MPPPIPPPPIPPDLIPLLIRLLRLSPSPHNLPRLRNLLVPRLHLLQDPCLEQFLTDEAQSRRWLGTVEEFGVVFGFDFLLTLAIAVRALRPILPPHLDECRIRNDVPRRLPRCRHIFDSPGQRPSVVPIVLWQKHRLSDPANVPFWRGLRLGLFDDNLHIKSSRLHFLQWACSRSSFAATAPARWSRGPFSE